MANTANLNLFKPTRDDYINVERDISQNMQKIDDAFWNTVDPSEYGIVVTGNVANVDVSEGQYVIVRQSTISDIDDGLYTAGANVTAGEAFSSSNLTPVAGGGMNAMKARVDGIDGKILGGGTSVDISGATIVMLFARAFSVNTYKASIFCVMSGQSAYRVAGWDGISISRNGNVFSASSSDGDTVYMVGLKIV